MNSKNIRTLLLLTVILIGFLSCDKSKRVVKEIDFTTTYKPSSEIENKVAKDTVPWKYQISASDYAIKGDYKNALIHWDLAMRASERSYTQSQIDSINQKYSKVNATDYIIEQAKEHQVVIINEAHHNSFHRVYTKSLLQELYNQGYKNFGLEALGNGVYLDTILNNRKYPIQETGHYTKDPQFGDLIREALEIGYHVFAYENVGEGTAKQREIEQARNIEKVLNSRPNEKFLIHCGFDHALEGALRSREKAMAGRLTEYTAIDPFTINQVAYSERSKPEFNHPLLKALNATEPSVIIDKENHPLKYTRGEAWADIAVFHPQTTYKQDRPHWIFEYGNKHVPIALNDIDIEYPVMVLAFKKGEDISVAIPMDIAEIKSKIDSCHLGLKKGDYNIVITNGNQSFTFEQQVE